MFKINAFLSSLGKNSNILWAFLPILNQIKVKPLCKGTRQRQVQRAPKAPREKAPCAEVTCPCPVCSSLPALLAVSRSTPRQAAPLDIRWPSMKGQSGGQEFLSRQKSPALPPSPGQGQDLETLRGNRAEGKLK